MRTSVIAALLLAALACSTSRTRAPRDSSVTVDSSPPGDATPVDSAPADTGPPPLAGALDLLLMVDNSNSMTEEQASMAAELPRLLSTLAESFDSMNVGVITSDMGTGGVAVPTCADSDFGDDGILRTEGNTTVTGCAATYPSFLSFAAGADPSSFASDVACVAVAGTGGCGFEQPLEAILKATTAGGTFHMGTSGHADGANAGFLRPGAHLTIVALTDEADCSARDPEIFDPTSSVYTSDLNLRCFTYPEALHPASRYVDGLLDGRNPSRVGFVAIAGIPVEVAGDDFGAILAHPDMQERIDPDAPTRLAPSCNVPGRGFAFPPRRVVSVARDLAGRGARTSAQSLCQASFSAATDAILDVSR